MPCAAVLHIPQQAECSAIAPSAAIQRFLLPRHPSAEDVMLWAGIDIWDIYTMTVVGDNRGWDMIHISAHALRAMNYDLIDQFACRS